MQIKTFIHVFTSALILCVLTTTFTSGAAAQSRSYSSANFVLELDGIKYGHIQSVESNGISGIVNAASPPEGLLRKHIGGVKYEDIKMRVGLSSTGALAEWIRGFLNNSASRKNGSIIACDFDYKSKHRFAFTNALITEIGFPACDGASKDAAFITIKITPETMKYSAGDGKQVELSASAREKQKKWLCSNFRFAIDGLDPACKKVQKIDEFTIKQKTAASSGVPGKIEYPNISFYVPENAGGDFESWMKQPKEVRKANLEFLDATKNEVLIGLLLPAVAPLRQTPKTDFGSRMSNIEIRVDKIEMK